MSDVRERESLPPEVLALGEPLAVYRGSAVLSVICLIVGVLGILVFVGGAIAGWATGGFKEGSPAGPIALVMAFLAVLGGGYLIYAGLALRKLRYAVCPGGLARVKGSRVDVLPWEGLRVVVRFHPNVMGSMNCFWFESGSKRWKVHYEVSGVDQLGQAVSQEIVRRELEPAAQRLERGEELKFGPITLARDGIGLKDQRLPWEEVSSVEDVSGPSATGPRRCFTIKQAGGKRDWGSVDAVKVPNFELLFALIRKLRPGVLEKKEGR